ncbi:hypothetical protein [Pedosphaera parvula]|nr:hypothetical protein [Pedosphaera parvula]
MGGWLQGNSFGLSPAVGLIFVLGHGPGADAPWLLTVVPLALVFCEWGFCGVLRVGAVKSQAMFVRRARDWSFRTGISLTSGAGAEG